MFPSVGGAQSPRGLHSHVRFFFTAVMRDVAHVPVKLAAVRRAPWLAMALSAAVHLAVGLIIILIPKLAAVDEASDHPPIVVELVALPPPPPPAPAAVPAGSPRPPDAVTAPSPPLPPPPPPRLAGGPIAERPTGPAATAPEPVDRQPETAETAGREPPRAAEPKTKVPKAVAPAPKAEPRSRPGTPPRKPGQADAPAVALGDTGPLGQTEQDFVLAQIVRYWRFDFGAREGRGFELRGVIVLQADGTLAPPLHKDSPWDPAAAIPGYAAAARSGNTYRKQALESFLLALRLAQPFDLPPGRAQRWPKRIDVRFRFDDLARVAGRNTDR